MVLQSKTYMPNAQKNHSMEMRIEISQIGSIHTQCLKMIQNVAFAFFNFVIFNEFLSFKIDLSGNTFLTLSFGF